MKRLSVNTTAWLNPATSQLEKPEPTDRLEEVRQRCNELQERLAKLEDTLYLKLGLKP